jgi:hypothetical protein
MAMRGILSIVRNPWIRGGYSTTCSIRHINLAVTRDRRAIKSSQLQLLQPFFGLTLAAVLLHEPIAWTMIASTLVVVACVAGAKRLA